MFSRRGAARYARRYRKRGLSGSQRWLADALRSCGIEGATVLEIGGGVGALQMELLRAGAAATTNIELSPEWEEAAAGLIGMYGVAERVTRRVGDFVDCAEELPRADVVILHRVVCCYPHWQLMLAAAAERANRLLALTFPVDRLRTRLALVLGNWTLALRRRQFRAFVHPAANMLATLGAHGFVVVRDQRDFFWRSVVLERA